MDLEGCITRRNFVRGMTAVAAVAMIGATGGCEDLIALIENRPVRRNIANLAANDPILQAYEAAIAAMKALPASNPLNWTNQASIHNNRCPHNNWYLLPWHRAYILYFERICRQLSGEQSFTLPYWNWTANPSVPAVFYNTSSQLYDATRDASQTDVADPGSVGPSTLEGIFELNNFFLFASGQVATQPSDQRDQGVTGQLEGTPHNYIHNFVGGDMGTFMSPLDPIFWTHHCMIDYCWVEWNINRSNPNTNDQNWYNFQLTDFFDQTGAAVTLQIAETLLFPLFSYQYEASQMGTHLPQAQRKRLSRSEARALVQFAKTGAAAHLEFSQHFAALDRLEVEAGRTANLPIKIEPGAIGTVLHSSDQRLFLRLQTAHVAETDFFVRVFINAPDANAETPIADPRYAGSFSIFMDEKSPMRMEPTKDSGFLVDLTPALKRLSEAGALGSHGQVGVYLVPTPFRRGKTTAKPLSLQGLELVVASVRP